MRKSSTLNVIKIVAIHHETRGAREGGGGRQTVIDCSVSKQRVTDLGFSLSGVLTVN
jgi:hypothetical protein